MLCMNHFYNMNKCVVKKLNDRRMKFSISVLSVMTENGLACYKKIDYKTWSERPQAPEEAFVLRIIHCDQTAFQHQSINSTSWRYKARRQD